MLAQIIPNYSTLDAMLMALLHERHGKPRLRMYSSGLSECICGPHIGKGFCGQSAYVNMVMLALAVLRKENDQQETEAKRQRQAEQFKVVLHMQKAKAYEIGRMW